jgi:putative ABC transport system permease protein
MAAVLVLALGIGANTAVFSLIETALLRRLPVAKPQELVSLGLRGGGAGASYPYYALVRDSNRTFQGVFAYCEIDAVHGRGREHGASVDIRNL